MNSRITRLFQFNENDSVTRPRQTVTAREKVEPPQAAAKSNDATKTAVAELIAELAKSEPRQRETGTGKTQTGPASGTLQPAKQERRHRRRVKISAPVRVRQVNIGHAAEFDLTMTIDVSREGVLFETSRQTYHRGEEVAVVFPYRPGPGESVREQRGQVVRVSRASEKRYGIAIAFIDGEPTYELVDAQGRSFEKEPNGTNGPNAKTPSHHRPLVIVVEDDTRTRMLLRSQLELGGYEVEGVGTPSEAVVILRHRSPAALIAEAEPFAGCMPGGGEMSGYDLCVIVRRNPKFARIPVILTTRTGAPSDFATAHALGATVCVAKPYDLERIANLVRVLTPADAA